jgi:hypothetical protein
MVLPEAVPGSAYVALKMVLTQNHLERPRLSTAVVPAASTSLLCKCALHTAPRESALQHAVFVVKEYKLCAACFKAMTHARH